MQIHPLLIFVQFVLVSFGKAVHQLSFSPFPMIARFLPVERFSLSPRQSLEVCVNNLSEGRIKSIHDILLACEVDILP